jgi:hypothetical protein
MWGMNTIKVNKRKEIPKGTYYVHGDYNLDAAITWYVGRYGTTPKMIYVENHKDFNHYWFQLEVDDEQK